MAPANPGAICEAEGARRTDWSYCAIGSATGLFARNQYA
jgi:hypothetical protein